MTDDDELPRVPENMRCEHMRPDEELVPIVLEAVLRAKRSALEFLADIDRVLLYSGTVNHCELDYYRLNILLGLQGDLRAILRELLREAWEYSGDDRQLEANIRDMEEHSLLAAVSYRNPNPED